MLWYKIICLLITKVSQRFCNILVVGGAYDKFPDFFVRAFKIVVDS